MHGIRSRLSYANVTATIALFLALAGGTTAVALSGKNSVKSDDIAHGAVSSDDIKALNVTSADIDKETIGGGKLTNGTVTASDLGAGSVGAGEILDGSIGTAEQAAAPAARVIGSVASVPANNAISADVAFASDSTGDAYDPIDMWTAANPDALTVPVSGMYLATGSVTWANDFTTGGALQDQGDRLLQISGSDGENQRSVIGPSRFGTEATYQSAAVILRLEAGETVSMQLAQDNEDDSAVAAIVVQMAATWIGPAP